jgi:hypothetical protein
MHRHIEVEYKGNVVVLAGTVAADPIQRRMPSAG